VHRVAPSVAVALEGQDEVTPAARQAVVGEVQAAEIDGATGVIAFDEFGDTVTKVLTIYRVTDGARGAVATEEVD
jgi:branched-chain amino acid transport system substrate-binding protein